jgi:hypothetical protein
MPVPLNIQMPYAGNALLDAERIRQARIQNTLLGMAAERQPGEYAHQDLTRRHEQENRRQAQELRKVEVMGNLMQGVTDQASYDIAKSRYSRIFGDQDLVGMPPEYSKKAVDNILAVTSKLLPQAKTKWSAVKQGISSEGNQVFFRTDDAGNVQIVHGVTPEPKRGMKIYDREGNLLVDMGGERTPAMSKKTQGAIEEKIVSGKEQLERMRAIQKEFKPEYQELGTRFESAWTSLKAKLGQPVEEADRKELVGFKKYQRKAIENINLYIKELTGAQMSEKEADRLRLAQPDPGEKWYQGDDPITFKAKMDDVIRMTRAAIARFEYYRNQGISDPEIIKMINAGKAVRIEDIAARME